MAMEYKLEDLSRDKQSSPVYYRHVMAERSVWMQHVKLC